MNKHLIGLVILGVVSSMLIAGCTASATPSNQPTNAIIKSTAANTYAISTAKEIAGANTSQGIHMIVVAQQGQTFTIWLRSNPSTGYRWQANYDPSYVTLVNQTFQSDPHPPGKVGVGGFDIWTFMALKAGTTTIRFDKISPAQQVCNSITGTVIIISC
jgi:predicted secreted protein